MYTKLALPVTTGPDCAMSGYAISGSSVDSVDESFQLRKKRCLGIRIPRGLSMNELTTNTWTSDWMWSLPLVLATVLLHTVSLGLINGHVTRILSNVGKYRVPQLVSVLVMGVTVLAITVLHGIEATIWGLAFRMVGAMPDTKLAVLYSLSAMTAYGHANVYLHPQWQFMGALEALNGLILFGLTTAFLFTVMQHVWPHVKRR